MLNVKYFAGEGAPLWQFTNRKCEISSLSRIAHTLYAIYKALPIIYFLLEASQTGQKEAGETAQNRSATSTVSCLISS